MSDPLVLSTPELALELDGTDERLEELLRDNAERFLLAGGTITLETWNGLTEGSRNALALAGEDLRVGMAAAIAIAIQSPQVAAMSASGMDDGDVRVRLALVASGDRCEGRAG